MTIICRIIGGAGGGKTSHLIGDRAGTRRGVMHEWIERGVNPFQIGFCSFTRAARSEAAERAALVSGESKTELEQAGNFRTVHSLVYRQLGVGKALLVDDKESRKWLAEALGVPQDATETLNPEDEPVSVNEASSDEMNALALWDVARARLEPLQPVWEAAAEINEFLPDWEMVRATVDRYEQYKRLDGRCDFSDILGRFSGVGFGIDGHDLLMAREGDSPDLKIWFFDEWQDASALLDRCARRLVESADVAYICGDPRQSIFSFAGSSHKHMLAWEPSPGKERILNQSYRCPRLIQELGEEILRECSDYHDWQMKPRDAEGQIDVEMFGGGWVHELDPNDNWLLMARSNAHVRRITQKLDAAGLPWMPTRGMGGKWAAPVRRSACLGLISLENGHPLSAAEWTAALKFLPSKVAEAEIVTHGAKSEWSRAEHKNDELTDLDHLGEWGGTVHLVELIRTGRWTSLIDNGLEFRDAWRQWGHKAVLEPKIEVGTIHCSPPGEPILTTNRGYVPIESICEGFDKLASFNPDRGLHALRRRKHAKYGGYEFSVTQRPYSGEMLTIKTNYSQTRVTPNHLIRVRYLPSAKDKHLVYLMRRGGWWRIGRTRMMRVRDRTAGLVRRAGNEMADEAWVLRVFESEADAAFEEARLSMLYGIPQSSFQSPPLCGRTLTNSQFHAIFDEASPFLTANAERLLRDCRLYRDLPFYVRNQNQMRSETRAFDIAAANIHPALLSVATIDNEGIKWGPFSLERHRYDGTVYDLEVLPHHYYFSGGLLVHNSNKGREGVNVALLTTTSRQCSKSMDFEEAANEERRVAYVGVTRVRERLLVLREKSLHCMDIPV